MKAASKPKKYEACTPEGKEAFTIGCAVLRATLPVGARATLEEIAAYTGLSRNGVYMMQETALKKLRKKFATNPTLKQLALDMGMKGIL